MPRLGPIPIKDRVSMVFLERGRVDVLDGAFVLVDKTGIRTHVPVGGVVCILLEPGTRVSHAAVALAARVGCLLCWVGEGGVRLYSAGQPGGARADRLLYQARIALDADARLRVVRKMYELRFGERAPAKRSVEQLRGMEGARVRRLYQQIGRRYGIEWGRRNYDRQRWTSADRANRCLSAATSCLYGIAEAGILAAGYSPAIGFLHTGKARSFVFDIADLVKFETVVPAAFSVAKRNYPNPEREIRAACRDIFREGRLLKRLIPLIHDVLAASGVDVPDHEGVVGPAFADAPNLGDDGQRGPSP